MRISRGLAGNRKAANPDTALIVIRQTIIKYFIFPPVKLIAGSRAPGDRVIATAHHADDNTETFFLNPLKGTEHKDLLGRL